MEKRLDEKWVRSVLPKRSRQAHKGDFGTLVIAAGSSQYRGAAVLCANAAIRTGAGIVQLASTEKVCAAVAAQVPCCTLMPLEETPAGGIAPHEAKRIMAKTANAILAGPGLGNTPDTAALVLELLQSAPSPLVLDADALNVLAGHFEDGNSPQAWEQGRQALAQSTQPLIITPHIGEMARLSGLSSSYVVQNQLGIALDFAASHNCTVVLKNHITIIACPDGKSYINDRTGNPGLARGGSGDVLAGVIAALLAQGLAPEIAAAAGVWLHASAADAAAAECSEMCLCPSDLPLYLRDVCKRLLL